MQVEYLAVFKSIHKGEGHKPCDARTAVRARKKAEKAIAEKING
jgi:hypothetical protein